MFPQGLPVVHFGALVWAEPPLRHVLINCLRASPFMPLVDKLIQMVPSAC